MPVKQNGKAVISGKNNMTASFSINTAKFGGLYFDAAMIGVNAEHTAEIAYQAINNPLAPTGVAGDNWYDMEESHWNDMGNGRLTATARDNANGWEGEATLNNKNFTQERIVVGDNTDLTPGANDRTRRSTLNINGEFGGAFKGLPLVWNTNGLFNFSTQTVATRSKYDDLNPSPALIESGFMTIGGSNGDITVEFTANTVLMQALGGTTTVLPNNLPFWWSMNPQP